MKLRWGMIGCGSAAEIRGGLGIRRSAASELVAVADIDEGRARRHAAEHDVPRWYLSGQELIDDPAVEAVYIAAPNKFHCEYTLAAARAGKHVLCEKPFATSLDENRRMIAACRDAGVTLGVSYYRRFYPSVQKARELISNGAIGRITLAGIHATHFLGEAWQPEVATRHWLIEKEIAGGGVFQRAGSHRIDVLVYLLGPVREVHALTERMLDGYDVEDASVAILRFSSGAQGWFVLHHTVSGAQTDWIEICGTRGRLLLDPLDDGNLRLETPDGAQEFKGEIGEATTLPIIEDFVRAVGEGRPTICSGEGALETNQVIYTGYRSSELGRSLPVGDAGESEGARVGQR